MADKSGCSDKETFLYLTQIKHLDEQLKRHQLIYDSLVEQRKGLVCLHRALEENSADIREFRNHCVAVQEKRVEQLLVELPQLQQAAAQERQDLQQEHRQQEEQLQEHVDELTAESRRQELLLEQQEEQRMQLMEQIQQRPAVTCLEEQQQKYKATVRSLQREARLERSRLIEQKQKTLDDSAKTREEAQARHSELTEEFLQLLVKNSVLWQQTAVLEETEKLLSSEVDQLSTELHQVNQEVTGARKKLQQLKKQKEEKVKDRRLIVERSQEKEENERRLLASASDECSQKLARVDVLRAELQAEGSRRRQLEGSVQEAAIILGQVLKDDSGRMSGKQSERLLELLQTPNPPVHSEETPDLAADPMFLLTCYRPGDLSLVPRPTWKHQAAPSSAQSQY